MPNHVTNELIFKGIDEAQAAKVLDAIIGHDGKVDFEKLLPIPINCWMFSSGARHEQAFKNTGLDWCVQNWGTKWNAYEAQTPTFSDGTLTIVFSTAWRPPYGWLAAVFNSLKVSFQHNWLSEGEHKAYCGVFNWPVTAANDFGNLWREEIACEPELRRLHKMRWGVESFDEEGEEQ